MDGLAEVSRLDDPADDWCEKAVTEGGRELGVDAVPASEDVDLEA